MAKVIKFPKKDEKPFDDEYANFVDDVGGFLWHMVAVTHKSFDTLGRDIGISAGTLYNLANRITKNPQGRTIWCILKGLDNHSVIRHSHLEQYRTFTKKTLDVMRSLEKKKQAKG